MQQLTRSKAAINFAEYVKRSALESDFSEIVREPTQLFDKDTGELVAVYDFLPPEARELPNALRTVDYPETERTGGLKTTSRIFGYMPRIALRSDFCRMAGLAKDSPQANALLLKNNPLKYHFDSGNFDGVFSCMLGFKNNIAGGYLSFPEYGLAFEIGNFSVSLFDGQSILHGVTPITRLSEDATRFTVVFYSLRQMWNCKPMTEELARIRKVKTEREIKRLNKEK